MKHVIHGEGDVFKKKKLGKVPLSGTITIIVYKQNIKALGLVVSERRFL